MEAQAKTASPQDEISALRQRVAELEAAAADRRDAEQAREAASRYARSLIEASPDPLVTISPDGKITDANRATERATGLPRARLIGSDFVIYFTEPERARAGYEQVIAEGQVRNYPLTLRHVSGATMDVLYNATVYRNDDGELQGVFAAARDISERKRAEEAMRAERQRLYDVLEMLPAYVALLAPDYSMPFVNRFFRERFGEPRGRRCYEFLFDRTEPCETCESYTPARTGAPHRWEWTGPDQRTYGIFDKPFRDSDGLPLILEMGIDITERKRAEEALAEANRTLEQRVAERTAELRGSNAALRTEIEERLNAERQLKALNETLEQRVAERTAVLQRRTAQLRVLTSELMQAEQRERRRLAQVLHDHLQQLLAAAKMQTGLAERRAQDGKVCSLLRHVEGLLDESLDVSRSLTVELSPPVLYELGLAPALHWLARWMEEKHGLTVRVQADDAIRVDSEDLRILLFQAVRELLFNVVKHAGVREASVALTCNPPQEVQLVVSDQGIGFTPLHAEGPHDLQGGFGLFGVQERLESLGGSVQISSAPGQGTCVRLSAPL